MSSRIRHEDYLQEHTLKSWLLTTDHKRIGILYMVSVTFFFFVGGAAATLMRLELMTPRGDVLATPDAYNRLFTMHGVIMIFFFLVPAIPAVLGNFLLPLMIGAQDLAFPKINLLSWYVYMIGGLMGVWIMIFGGVDTGWTFYTPFSTMFSNTMVVPAAVAVFITGFSSILTGLNFIVTVHTMRAPGMTWFADAAVRLVALRDEPHHGAGHAGAGDLGRSGRARAAVRASASSTRPWAATRSSSSTCSGSTRTRPCTSWCCRASR